MWTLAVFPSMLLINNSILQRYTGFYTLFSFREKCEYLAWLNTVFFQTSFSILNLMYYSQPQVLVPYFFTYAVYDTLFLPFYNRDALYYVHHILAICLSYIGLYAPLNVVYSITRAVEFLEASNILLGIAWLLNRAGHGKALVTKIIGGVAVIVYLLFRNIMFPLQLFNTEATLRIALLPFIPMNMYWSWKLIRFYMKILGGASS